MIALLAIWAGPLAPEKELLVTTTELPKLDGSAGTTVAYGVYYVWNGHQEEHPWWVIFHAPLKEGGFEWAILEVADVGDIDDPDQVGQAMNYASKFDENWFDNEMHTVQRTRFEALQHIFFGSDALEKERAAIDHVLNFIGLLDK